MSRNLNTSNEKKGKNKQNIFHTNIEDNTESNLSRKRSERQASQGVKLLVDREKGINQGSNPQAEASTIVTPEVKKVVPTPSNFNPSINQANAVNNLPQSAYNPMMQSLHPLNTNFNPSSTSQMTITPGNLQKTTHHSNSHSHYKHKDDKIINRINLEKIINEKLKREGLEVKNMNETTNFINIGLENYMKNVIEKLIAISRMRNVNLNLYSKQSEKNPIFKIHTYNMEKVSNQEVGYIPYRDFSILFTKNMKNTMGMLEQYEELNLKKLRQEKVSLYKSKLEEITQQKEKEKGNLDTNKAKESAVQGKIKPRARKRDTILKSVRNTLAKSQKRDEMAKHKKETQNTLDTFLDGRPRSTAIGNANLSQSQSHQRFDTEMVSNIGESHNLETFTKFSEISKSEVPGEIVSNDINLTIFKYYLPSQNPKLNMPSTVRRRITLKDMIHYLEGERKTPLQNLILHKALVKLNQSSLNM